MAKSLEQQLREAQDESWMLRRKVEAAIASLRKSVLSQYSTTGRMTEEGKKHIRSLSLEQLTERVAEIIGA